MEGSNLKLKKEMKRKCTMMKHNLKMKRQLIIFEVVIRKRFNIVINISLSH